MLRQTDTVLILVDIQEKLIRVAYESDVLLENIRKMVKGARSLGIPILFTEQYPEGLGPTVPEIRELLADQPPISKLAFSCCREPRFMPVLAGLQRQNILLAGIETHVCVYQTARDLLAADFQVHVLSDAVSSRTLPNRLLGLEAMKGAGAVLSGVEMALFELLEIAQGPTFKEISRLVR
jgi:nicotinamidase-related amidase